MLAAVNMGAVATICTYLDGRALAIELVSARVKVLWPAALLARLRECLLLDNEEMRDITPRDQTLHQAIGWSYELLTFPEQTLLARMGVFIGGFTLEITDEVCSGADNLRFNFVDGLTSLVDKNLIYKTDGEDGEARFAMLETIHEYALERLAANGEGQSVPAQMRGWAWA